MFKKFLSWVRGTYTEMPNTVLIVGFGTIAIGAILGFIFDYFLPFNFWWNILRTLVVVPMSVAIFTIGYIQAIELHDKKVEQFPEWESYRERFSPSARKKISAVIAALLVVISYASTYSPFYTIVTASVIASVIALFAFMRLTGYERIQEDYGLPDSRDVNFQRRLEKVQEERRKAEKKAAEKKAAKRRERWSIETTKTDKDKEDETAGEEEPAQDKEI